MYTYASFLKHHNFYSSIHVVLAYHTLHFPIRNRRGTRQADRRRGLRYWIGVRK